jgi:hypothetical protein
MIYIIHAPYTNPFDLNNIHNTEKHRNTIHKAIVLIRSCLSNSDSAFKFQHD